MTADCVTGGEGLEACHKTTKQGVRGKSRSLRVK